MAVERQERPRPLVVLACALLLVASTAVLVWRLSGRPEERRTPGARTVRALLERSWATDAGQRLILGRLDAPYLVLYLFTPQDCAACLDELAALGRFAGDRRALAVVAVMAFSNVDEARQTRRNFDLSIPILQDPDGEFVEAVAPPQKPWKVVVDRAAGEVLFEEAAAVDPLGVERFLGRLEALAGR